MSKILILCSKNFCLNSCGTSDVLLQLIFKYSLFVYVPRNLSPKFHYWIEEGAEEEEVIRNKNRFSRQHL